MSAAALSNGTTPSITTPPLAADGQQHIRLACQACQRKKIKCDRTFPCGQCTKSSLTCVPSSRKQRMRHAGKRAVDGELRSRIAKLESLVESLSGDPNAADKATNGDTERSTPTRSNSTDNDSNGVGKYVASSFWSSLTSEFAAIREALEEDDLEEYTPDAADTTQSSPPLHQSPDQYGTVNHDIIIAPPGKIFVMPGVLQDPDASIRPYLIDCFFLNVERMVKVWHRPTLRAAIEQGADYLGHSAGSWQHDALRQLIWFGAFNSLPEDEVMSLTRQPKADIVSKYRRYVGILISQLDLLNTNDLATLQLLAVFITICRTSDNSRRTWTSLALLLRNAQAIYLHQDDPTATPFIRELRRRLWHFIRLLDKFCALDRGSPPLIKADDFTIPLPLNTNDDMFGPASTEILDLGDRITDMFFARMCYESCDTIEALLVPEVTANGLTWEERRVLAVEMGKNLQKKYLSKCDLSITYQRFQNAIGKSICSAMIVRAVRPMQRHLSSVPPPVDSPEVLKMAVDNLESSYVLFADPDFDAWKWMRWVPWHCLAVAVAGLCSQRGTPETVKAWALVEPAYRWCSRYVADGEDGMLWRPVTKLYKKAVSYRDNAPTSSYSMKGTVAQPIPAHEVDPVKMPAATIEATAKWTHPWRNNPPAFKGMGVLPAVDMSSTPNVEPLAQPAQPVQVPQGMDYLSTNFSSMQPFAYPPVTNGAALYNGMPQTIGDPSWGDWGQMLDEFQNPLAGGSEMDMDLLMNEWSFNQSMPQQQQGHM